MKSAGITLEQVLSDAESLSPEDQAILAELLHNRRMESWRKETAAAARKAAKEFRAGKVKPESVAAVIKRLRSVR